MTYDLVKTYDLAIKGAQIYDGSGSEPSRDDLYIKDGRIALRQPSAGNGPAPVVKQSVIANGLALMPGIVDLHTHYDAQITWDRTCSPSPALGVTTVVIGNCGFGIAPCPPAQRETMMKNLSVVEGMDLNALLTGTRWGFESFAQYLTSLREQGPFVNVGVFAGHSTIRTAVMGNEASQRQPTAQELALMVDHVRQAIDAGAIGFASSFSPNHSGFGGMPMPSTIASDDELAALVGVLGEKGRGVFMSATGPRATPDYMEQLAAATGRPMFISTVLSMYNDAAPQAAMAMYERCGEALARGREVYIQANCQPLCFEFTLVSPYVLFSHSAFAPVQAANGDLAQLKSVYGGQQIRADFRANLKSPKTGILFYGDWSQIEVRPALEANQSMSERGIAELAAEAGQDPIDWLFDFALSENLQTMFLGKFYQNRDEGVAPLLKHPAGVVSLSDAGAHLSYMCDAGFGIHMLSHWVRNTGTFSLAEAVRRLTSHPAQLYRIAQRGLLREGYWADMLLFDPAKLALSKLASRDDLPGGGRRMVRSAAGVQGVWVNGVQTFDGKQYLNADRPGPGKVLDQFAA